MHLKETEISAETWISRGIFAVASFCLLCVAVACSIAIIVCVQNVIDSWMSIESSLYLAVVPVLFIVGVFSSSMVVMLVIEIIANWGRGKK
jgi:hypothetical protein